MSSILDLWKLLSSSNIEDNDYNIESIFEYLSLLKLNSIKISLDTDKAKKIEEYIRKYTPEAILALNDKDGFDILEKKDLEYYNPDPSSIPLPE